jgi:hypothetical protein
MMRKGNLPRVFSTIPTRGQGNVAAIQSHFALASRGEVEVIPGMAVSSLLCQGFNMLWAAALTLHEHGIADYFLMHHDDVEVTTPGWLDVMVREMRSAGAAVLSAVVAIKDDSGDTSTALETGNQWAPRRLSLAECHAREETWTESGLLVNTGLMLVDLARPEFHAADESGELRFSFAIQDRIVRQPDGSLRVQTRPEDWEFSRRCRRHLLPVYATRKVEAIHHGDRGHTNQLVTPVPVGGEIQGWFDFADVYREAVERTPDGGTLVEVGCWKGKSLAYLLGRAKLSGKKLRVVGVDHFRGSVGEPDLLREASEKDIKAECWRNCEGVGYPFELTVLSSAFAATTFAPESVDFVFLDASHDRESALADIKAWLPKVKRGGVLAGHDIDAPGVRAAVDQVFEVRIIGRSWWYDKR